MIDPLEFLQTYVRIDTSNPPGDCREAAKLLSGILENHGLSPSVFGATPEKPNVFCHVGGTEEPGLILIHHMDVVPARAEEWSVPPFSGEIRDGYMYGRGTLDTKSLGVAHWCAALRAMKEGILRRKLFLAANPDEEVGGGDGAEYFVKHLPFSLGEVYGLNEGGVGVPNMFGIKGKFFLLDMWEKGPVWMKLEAKGSAGHGSRPSKQDAPARLARAAARIVEHHEPARMTKPVLDMLRTLREKGFARHLFDEKTMDDPASLERLASEFPEIAPLLRNTFALTTLLAGFKPNVIPSGAEGTIDSRILPGENPDNVAKRLREMIQDLDVSLEILFAEMPTGSAGGPLYDALEDAILSVHPDAVVTPYLATGFTDSRFYRGIGIPTYGLMPMLLPRSEQSRVHGVDERIHLDNVREMTDITFALIRRWNQDSAASM
ncbi:MAG: M20/M25/M40 family metallo-hydrolase [Syntrophorhabdaceae bacterium]|nr:M20/M25/M40 family metallo-hydrolase [Syntrophorhabdaceae bacterium]